MCSIYFVNHRSEPPAYHKPRLGVLRGRAAQRPLALRAPAVPRRTAHLHVGGLARPRLTALSVAVPPARACGRRPPAARRIGAARQVVGWASTCQSVPAGRYPPFGGHVPGTYQARAHNCPGPSHQICGIVARRIAIVAGSALATPSHRCERESGRRRRTALDLAGAAEAAPR